MAKTKLSKELIVPTFDYSGIDPEAKSKLINLAGQISRAKAFHVKYAFEIGEAIQWANDTLSEHGCYGRFGEWVERECNISRSTAYNYMWAWNRFGSCEAVGQINDGAMYLLAAPKIPKEASAEAEKLAKKGVKITIDLAKEIIQKHRPKPQPAADEPEPHSSNEIQSEAPIAGNSEPSEPLEGRIDAEEPADDFDPTKLDATDPAKVDIKGLAAPYQADIRLMNAKRKEWLERAEEPRTGAHIAPIVTRIEYHFKELVAAISQAEPVEICSSCDGVGCNTCARTGFWTRAIKGSRKT